MPLYRDDAVVLRTHKLGEADRIVTMLTRRHGRVRAVAKGVRRTTSRFGARLEPFSHVEVMLYEGRELDVVTQAETVTPYARGVGRDYARYTAGTAVLEVAERMSEPEREPALRLFLLLTGAVRALSETGRAPGLVLDAFLLRALGLAGYAPALTDCARCGDPGPHLAFAPAAGGSVCPACRAPGSASASAESLRLLVALRDGDWPVAESTAAAMTAARLAEASGLVAAHLRWHAERDLRSLPMVDRSAGAWQPAAPTVRAVPLGLGCPVAAGVAP